eukprot:TRINITY_DN2046_c0_g1_i1.p1 TRINITY_DN2046_c0_g1~~TRINITY_DN2046_c0_g1_i1.p1  ORF type:complete len:394 (+),score=79.56 TRINITY_DN2046_c0_g1_i1:46-1182(+)
MDPSVSNQASLSGKIVILELGASTSFGVKANIRQKLIKAGANVSIITRRDASCLITSQHILTKGGFKIDEARKIGIPVLCVDDIDDIIQNPSKYLGGGQEKCSNIGTKAQQTGFQSPLVAKAEAAWSPSPLPIDLSDLVPQIPLKFSTDSIPKPLQTQETSLAQTPSKPTADSDNDFWSFPEPIQQQTPAPNPTPAAPAWRPREESSLPLDLNALVPSFAPPSKPKPPKDSWKTRSTFNLVKAQSNASDLHLLDVQNRILALLNVENRSLVVVEHVDHDGIDDDDDDDGTTRRRRFKYVEPEVTYCDVAKLPVPPPPKKPRRILPKESLLEPPESRHAPAGRRRFQRRQIDSATSLPASLFDSDPILSEDLDSGIESW